MLYSQSPPITGTSEVPETRLRLAVVSSFAPTLLTISVISCVTIQLSATSLRFGMRSEQPPCLRPRVSVNFPNRVDMGNCEFTGPMLRCSRHKRRPIVSSRERTFRLWIRLKWLG
jgi:hypothetical protein